MPSLRIGIMVPRRSCIGCENAIVNFCVECDDEVFGSCGTGETGVGGNDERV